MRRTLSVSLGAFLISILALATFAQGVGLRGRWAATLERGGKSMTSVMDLKVSGNQVTGTIDLAPGTTLQIQNGKFERGQLTFDVTAPEPGRTKEIHFVGEFDGDLVTLRNESRGRQGRTLTYRRSRLTSERFCDAADAGIPRLLLRN